MCVYADCYHISRIALHGQRKAKPERYTNNSLSDKIIKRYWDTKSKSLGIYEKNS